MEEQVREDVERGLTILAIHDDRFREGIRTDLEGTLRSYGFDLNSAELEGSREFIRSVDDLTDEQLLQRLTGGSAAQRR